MYPLLILEMTKVFYLCTRDHMIKIIAWFLLETVLSIYFMYHTWKHKYQTIRSDTSYISWTAICVKFCANQLQIYINVTVTQNQNISYTLSGLHLSNYHKGAHSLDYAQDGTMWKGLHANKSTSEALFGTHLGTSAILCKGLNPHDPQHIQPCTLLQALCKHVSLIIKCACQFSSEMLKKMTLTVGLQIVTTLF